MPGLRQQWLQGGRGAGAVQAGLTNSRVVDLHWCTVSPKKKHSCTGGGLRLDPVLWKQEGRWRPVLARPPVAPGDGLATHPATEGGALDGAQGLGEPDLKGA
jgi:hypothetical protein